MGKKAKNKKWKKKAKASAEYHDDDDDGGDGTVQEASGSPPRKELIHFTPEEESKELTELTREERILAYADLYGKKPPEDLDLTPFERELSRIPSKRKAAFRKVCAKGLYTKKQACLFLRIEDYDAKAAAERMVKYWDRRYAMDGEDAFVFTDDRTEEDFHRTFKMAEEAMSDPEADKETKGWAKLFATSYLGGQLQLLEDDVNNLPAGETRRLVEAFVTRPDIANDERFLLQFLRCEDFNSKRAAQRMAKYWDFRLSLLGPEDAYRSLTIEYLMEHHPAELSCCPFLIAPGTDASGRGILHWSVDRVHADGLTDEGILKVIWYIYHVFLEDKSIRENGIVLVNNSRYSHALTKIRWSLISRYLEFALNCMPIKIRAFHSCPLTKSSIFFQLVAPVIKYLIGKKMRCRYWIHAGRGDEVASELEVCGIARDQILTVLGGEIDFDSVVHEWIEERRNKGL